MELKLKLIRQRRTEHYTEGKIYVNNEYICDSLEPPVSCEHHPAIPLGSYGVQMFPSAKFRALRPILIKVPGRSGILIHEGNTARNTLGCILVGSSIGNGKLINSKSHLRGLIDWIKSILKRDGTVTIEIVNAD